MNTDLESIGCMMRQKYKTLLKR